MYFKRLRISEWQQFKKVEIDFHKRLTVLTGANGSGKTTILDLLARHFGWEKSSLATPKKDKKSGVFKYLPRLFNGFDKSDQNIIGELLYGDGNKASLQVPNQNTPQYSIQINFWKKVKCFYIPSHRSLFRYQAVDNIPTAKKNKLTAFQEVSNSIKNRYFSNKTTPSSFVMKNTLIGWAIKGYGVQNKNEYIMQRDEEQIIYYEGFQNVLKKILPKTLGFERIEIRNMEIVFVCNGGKDEFVLETASGGISSLIDISWQIYMYSSKENNDFTVLIDEVENHLHPTMQRQILPDLLNAFPNARFVVSTHSPLVVGSVKNSNIFVLRYDDEKKIISSKLDLENKAKTASEILDEVLGVSFTMPLWAEEGLEEIVEKYSKQMVNKYNMNEMRKELSNIGLEKLMPEAICNVIDKKND